MALNRNERSQRITPEEQVAMQWNADRRILETFFSPSEQHNYLNVRSVTARSWMNELRQREGNPNLTMSTLPDEYWDELLFDNHVHALYIIGIYENSEAARQDSLQYLDHYRQMLRDPHLQHDRIVGSGFALVSDNLHPVIADDWDEWDFMVQRLNERGVQVCIDYVPNHVALDHPWRETHPEYILEVELSEYKRKPQNYLEYIDQRGQVHYYARGKHYTNEGNEEVWTDTLQLDYRNPSLRTAMQNRLLHLVDHSNMVRVDTAPLPSYEIFRDTWGDIVPIADSWDFWGEATRKAREKANSLQKPFTILGEAYSSPHVLNDFDGVYGSALYGELVNAAKGWGNVHAVRRELFNAYNRNELPRLLNFGSNHDLEPTITKFGNLRKTLAALSIVSFTPSDWLIHHGEELLRLNPPMQVTEPYIDSCEPDLALQTALDYQWRLFFRNSQVVQEGRASFIDTHSPIIAQRYDLRGKGMIMCTNINEHDTICSIPIEHGLQKHHVRVFDFDTYAFLDSDIISDPSEGKMTILLKPWGRQMLLIDK